MCQPRKGRAVQSVQEVEGLQAFEQDFYLSRVIHRGATNPRSSRGAGSTPPSPLRASIPQAAARRCNWTTCSNDTRPPPGWRSTPSLDFRHGQVFDDDIPRLAIRTRNRGAPRFFPTWSLHRQTGIARPVQRKAWIVRHAAVGEQPGPVTAPFDRSTR
ncbi:MAG: hypothetical protein MZV64_59900 [Ignavibacteriales bacterium]|nr:hypothetical protein [Ignavibacteriales bacterium]